MNHPPPMTATLDHNGKIAVTYQAGQLTIDLSQLTRPQVLGNDQGHFQQGMKLYADGEPLPITPYFDGGGRCLHFEGEFPPNFSQLELRLYDQPILHLLHKNGALGLDAEHAHARLTVDELRMLATSDIRQEHVPTEREVFDGFDPQKHAPITDLHTHSSAQLSNHDILKIALDHDLDYPTELLDKLGIQLTAQEKKHVKPGGGIGARFAPLEHEEPKLDCEIHNAPCDVIPLRALSLEHRQRLEEQMQVPQDMTLSFSDFDRQYYRFVNPLVKNPNITKDMILTIARRYQQQGVHYAELSTASMLNLDAGGQARWFKEMIEATREAEEETGVKLRYLIGVPRSYGPAKVMAELEKIKYAARHPLIAGVDLLGYESNPTSNFQGPLSHIADWARAPEGTELHPEDGWNFTRDFTIRIHAGETAKNDGNVAEAVDIAERFGVKVRIAHAVNEAKNEALDRKIKQLSSKEPPLVSMEFCPSSNLAYNNVQDVHELPLKRWLTVCKRWFLGSDGAGAIQTTPTQLALSALSAGCTLKQLESMRTQEELFIRDANKNFDEKTAAFEKFYGGGKTDPDDAFLKDLTEHIKRVNALIDPKTLDPIHPALPKSFEGKTPLLIAGASGDSYKLIAPDVQAKIARAMRMLVAAVDPQKAYFVVGRSKSEGVTAALDEAIMAHNQQHPNNKFNVLALITEDIPDLPRSVSWVVPQKGKRENVPDNIVAFMRGTLGKIPGISMFIGGTNFTSDMILKVRQANGELPYLLMENAAGASASFTAKTATASRFNNGKSLVTRLMGLFDNHDVLKGQSSIFREGVTQETLQALADQLTEQEKEARPGAAEKVRRSRGNKTPTRA